LDAAIRPVFEKFGISRRDMSLESHGAASSGMRKYRRVSREYFVGDIDIKKLTSALDERLKRTAFKPARRGYAVTKQAGGVLYTVSFKGMNIMSMRFKAGRKAAAPRPAAPKKEAFKSPKVAIVLDDFGNNTTNLEALFAMRIPVTFSVLPNLRYSSVVSGEAASRGYEVILHLPLEPHRKDVREEANSINSRLPKEEILRRIERDLESVPDAVGVSNHMGSKSTEEPALMETIFKALKPKGLFFLDSLVTDDSCCAEVALKVGIPFARRDVFLDNESDEEYIRERLLEVKEIAFSTGSCIAIGHDRKMTVRALNRALPELEREGIRFVKVKELVR